VQRVGQAVAAAVPQRQRDELAGPRADLGPRAWAIQIRRRPERDAG
jgi:hypothetical protein